jgi:hypothetical protein
MREDLLGITEEVIILKKNPVKELLIKVIYFFQEIIDLQRNNGM